MKIQFSGKIAVVDIVQFILFLHMGIIAIETGSKVLLWMFHTATFFRIVLIQTGRDNLKLKIKEKKK